MLIVAESPNTNCEWFLLNATAATSVGQVVVRTLTVTECMRLCQDLNLTCASLSYNTLTNECRFHTQNTRHLQTSAGDATWATYDYYCFEGAEIKLLACALQVTTAA